ncbi:MAG: helix-turn-helix transcriptional regulator [Comamonadaceae bacterium]|jgi:DNA-binding transcriptional ArsR family regulator|nr:helix-turn-helix transcriptional regulator [Comamonadaceae bacterium]
MHAPFEPALTAVASLLADPSRSRMLLHLLGGRKASASDLAAVAGVSAATASGHLHKLLDGRLIRVEPRGRHRYYALADESVARLLESLASVSEREATSPAWRHPARARLKYARCCYRHLAGELGVALFSGLMRRGAFEAVPEGLALTPAGHEALRGFGFTPTPSGRRRRYAYACHDWSEGVDHLAGELAEQLLGHVIEQGWLRQGEGRALTLTPRGTTHWLPRLRELADGGDPRLSG